MEKSHGINCSDLELPSWLKLRPTSRPTVSTGTMTGLEVTKADARLLMVTAGQRRISLALSGEGLESQAPEGLGVLLTSPK